MWADDDTCKNRIYLKNPVKEVGFAVWVGDPQVTGIKFPSHKTGVHSRN